MSNEVNRIWIELDSYKNYEQAKMQCALANKLLTKVYDYEYGENKLCGFFVMPEENNDKSYYFSNGGAFNQLINNGEWFNLDSVK